jgi:hypothetical protein
MNLKITAEMRVCEWREVCTRINYTKPEALSFYHPLESLREAIVRAIEGIARREEVDMQFQTGPSLAAGAPPTRMNAEGVEG